MFRKLFCGFCNQVQSISTFQQLQNIMNPPTPENYQRLLLTVQQMIQSYPINWKFVHRLQQLKEQFSLELDMPYLLSKLKDQPIDSQKQQIVIDIMQQNFTIDDELFKDLFNQLLRMDDLHFSTQLKMLDTYFQYPEFFNQDKVLPRLLQNMIAQDDLEIFDLVNAFKVFSYNDPYLNEDNKQWLDDFKDELNQQIIKIIPALGQKQFRQLLIVLRSNEYYNESLKEVIFQYFYDNKDILGQSSLIELLSLCNQKFYQNEDLKNQILIQLNLLKVRGINESRLINKYVLPSISLAEQEMMANLITLSGIQLDKEFIYNHFTGSVSQKKEKLEQIKIKEIQVQQIVKELLKYIDGQFAYLLNVMKIIQTFGLSLPEVLQPLQEELKKILSQQIVNPSDLLTILNYFDDCNIHFDQEDSIGIQHLNNFLKQDQFSNQKIHYLQRQLAFKKNQQLMCELLNKSYRSGWTLELCSKQALIFNFYNMPLSKIFQEKFQSVIEDYISKKKSIYDQIIFYKSILMADWTGYLNFEQKRYFNEGLSASTRMKKEKLKNQNQSDSLQQDIKNDLLQYLPNTLKLLSNQYVDGNEIDFIITNQKGEKLFIQIREQSHFYYSSTVYNYKTLLEKLQLQKLGISKDINYQEIDQWKQNKQKAVENLISCLM